MNAITQATTNAQGVMNAITQATTNIFTTISTHAADPTTFMSETASDTCLISVVLVLVVVCLVLLVLCRMFKNKGTYLTHEAECGDSIRTSDSASLREEPLLELVDEKD
ncbi:hypothetical protein DPEC_G00150370 [Dallia pectoralis]|uniref:Uncharacterized protein n=1 Tax=Dallia pectoralis TaxID=75939 RepID=A0ACC2GIW3_DALPE|nr:hypothetical protein DPEC_G00150370 [Dallia pectoralis]